MPRNLTYSTNAQGWKQLKRHARTAKKRLIRKPLRNPSTDKAKESISMHGWEVPRDYAHAFYNLMFRMVKTNGEMPIDLEIEQIKEYQGIKES